MMYIHTPSLTPSLIHSLTSSLTHSLTHSLTPQGTTAGSHSTRTGVTSRRVECSASHCNTLEVQQYNVALTTHYSLLATCLRCVRDTNSCVCVCAVWTICCVNFFLYYKMYMFMRALNTSNSACTSGAGSGTCTISNGNSMSGSGSGSGRSPTASRASFIMNSVRFLSRSTSTSVSTTTGGSGGESKAMQVVLRLRWYPGE